MISSVPEISIIVPVYKINEKYLRKCIESLLKQTISGIEILLIVDGSPDFAGTVCEEYSLIDERITTIHQVNSGVSVARNMGLEQAAGKYVMFVDGDDWLETNCCEVLLNKIKEAGTDVVFYQRIYRDENDDVIKEFPSKDDVFLKKEDIKDIQLSIMRMEITRYGFDAMPPWGKIIKREVIENNHLRFIKGVKKAQDVLFNLYLYESIESAYYTDFTGYCYRIHGESVNRRYNPEMPDILRRVVYEADRFITDCRNDDKELSKALGVRCIKDLSRLSNVYWFNKKCTLSLKEIEEMYNRHLNDPVIKKHVAKCKAKDFARIPVKVRFIMKDEPLLHVYLLLYGIKYK